MKVKMTLIVFLSAMVLQSVYADIDISIQNNIKARKNTDIQVCAGHGNCSDWVTSSTAMYNFGYIRKLGCPSKGQLLINYKSNGKTISRAVALPVALDKQNSVSLIIMNEKGLIRFSVLGVNYDLRADLEDV